MDIRKFNPYIRFCSPIKVSESYPETYKAYDFRLFHVLEGGFTAVFDTEEITVNKGETLMFPPNIAYRMLINEYDYSNHIIVNFDFVTDNYGSAPQAPTGLDRFKKDKVFSTCSLPPFDRILHLSDTWSSTATLKEMCQEINSNNPHSQEIASAMFKKLLVELARKEKNNQKLINIGKENICMRIKDYIDNNFLLGINNIDIAKKFGYHPYAINAKFKKTENITIHSYITSKKLELAKEFLLSTNLSIAEISEKCGFSNPSYFSECFMKNEGITPLGYRKNAR